MPRDAERDPHEEAQERAREVLERKPVRPSTQPDRAVDPDDEAHKDFEQRARPDPEPSAWEGPEDE